MSGRDRRRVSGREVMDDWEPDHSPQGRRPRTGSLGDEPMPWERDRLPRERPVRPAARAPESGRERGQQWNELFWEPEKRLERRRRGSTRREPSDRQDVRRQDRPARQAAARPAAPRRYGRDLDLGGRDAARARGAVTPVGAARRERVRTGAAGRRRDRDRDRELRAMPAVGGGRPPLRVPGGRTADGIGVAGTVVTLAVAVALLAVVERAVMDGGAVTQASAGARLEQQEPQAPKTRPTTRTAPVPEAPAEPVRPLAEEVRSLTLAERGAQARRSYGAAADRPPLVGATRFSADRTWAFGTSAIPVPRGRAALPQVALFVAKLTGGQWKLALAGTPEFAGMLGSAPVSMIPAAEKRVLASYSKAKAVNAGKAGTGLMLPWTVGESWSLSAVAQRTTEGTRPLGLVAFDGEDGQVRAAGAGRLYRFCGTAPGRGLIMIIHEDGLATLYYQMKQVTGLPDGTVVEQGVPLGRIGTDLPCGGEAAGPQVQFGLRQGPEDVPLDGVTLGGWTFHERAVPLVGWASRGLLQVLPGGRLKNLGAVPADDSVLPPAPGPSAGPASSPSPGQSPETSQPSQT